jgi:hypothetical protein
VRHQGSIETSGVRGRTSDVAARDESVDGGDGAGLAITGLSIDDVDDNGGGMTPLVRPGGELGDRYGAIVGYNDHGHVDNDYKVVGTGDFNGDGLSGDILWRHVTGQLVAWELNGGQQIGYFDLGHVSNEYQIVNIGNGNSNSDILWRHVSGKVLTWELDGGSIAHIHDLGHVDKIWQIQTGSI